MSSAPASAPIPRAARGSGTELWLLRVGSRAELEPRLAGFGTMMLALVVSPPGGDEERWARAFAKRHGAARECRAELRSPAAREDRAQVGERAWRALEVALSRGAPRVLAVLPGAVLGPCVAHALDLPATSAAALRVDAGRAVLLRDDPIGIVLRRSNVVAPETEGGTALPGGDAGGR